MRHAKLLLPRQLLWMLLRSVRQVKQARFHHYLQVEVLQESDLDAFVAFGKRSHEAQPLLVAVVDQGLEADSQVEQGGIHFVAVYAIWEIADSVGTVMKGIAHQRVL